MDFIRELYARDPWPAVGICTVALLVLVLLGMIVRQLFAYTLMAIAAPVEDQVSRRNGLLLFGSGLAATAAVLAILFIPGADQNRFFVRLAFALALFALYALAEGLGRTLFARRRVGLIALIWGLLAGLVALLVWPR